MPIPTAPPTTSPATARSDMARNLNSRRRIATGTAVKAISGTVTDRTRNISPTSA